MLVPRTNRLLSLLSDNDYERLRPHLSPVVFDYKKSLYEAARPIEHMYFPIDGVASLVLMMTACLFLRTLYNLSRVDVGFNKENILRLSIDSTALGFQADDPRARVTYHNIEDRVSTLPGVEAASFSAFTFNEASFVSSVALPGKAFDRNVIVNHNVIGKNFFKVMQIPLVAGRAFGPQDTATSQPVTIIGVGLARYLCPTGSPIGRTYLIGSADDRIPPDQKLVVGVVKDVKIHGLEGPDLYIDYLPYDQSAWGFGDFELRYTGNFSAVTKEVQEAIWSVNRQVPLADVPPEACAWARS